MTGPWAEGDFELDFAGALSVTKLDAPALGKPPDMKAVDFVVEESGRILLVELKDPSDPSIPAKHRPAVTGREKTRRLGDDLIRNDLVPKARHSYTYLHLMKRDVKPLVFVLLDDPSALDMEAALLTNYKDRLLARLRHEARDPWEREYVADCVVASPTTWGTYFPGYALRRVSSNASGGAETPAAGP